MMRGAMQGIPLLLRLARQEADSRRVALAEAERAREAAARQRAAFGALMAAEEQAAQGDAEAMARWSSWIGAARRQAGMLDRVVAERQMAEDALRDALREDFATIKRLEITLEQKLQMAARQAARKAEQRLEDAELQRRR